MINKIEKDFNKFSASNYLNEYYSDIGFENKKLLSFFNRIYISMSKKTKLLEFGGGPTIYQLISARNKVKEIIFSEYGQKNRNEIKRWVKSDNAFDWDNWFKYVLKLEGKKFTEKNISLAKKSLRDKIVKVIKCDAYKTSPLNDKKYKNYFDIVSVNFVPESATDNEKDYQLFLKNIFSQLKPGGVLIFTMLQGAKFYHVGKMKFPAFPIDNKKHIIQILEKHNFIINNIENIKAEQSQGYPGMIFLKATKNKK